MKIKIGYDAAQNKVYVNKGALILLSGICLLLTICVVGIFMWQNNSLTLLSQSSQYRPLGVAPTVSNGESPSQAVLQELQKDYGNKLNIIFFYDGYSDQNEALGKIKVLEAAILGVEPFKSLQDMIAFKIFTTSGQACHVETAGAVKNLSCDPKMTQGLEHLGIPHIKVVVLSPLEFISSADLARGKDSVITISTYPGKLNDNEEKRFLGLVFTHEMGHALGLRDEYSKGRVNDFPEIKPLETAGLPNCAPDLTTAKKWWGESGSYFKGCAGNPNYYYPVDSTLMSAWPAIQGYGKISENYLNGAISCFYAGKESYLQNGNSVSCSDFEKEYPKFWEE